jgi:hypothetical protein
MVTPQRPFTGSTPTIEDTAREIGRTGRIVVQAFIAPELWAEVERRLYLTVLGHFLNETRQTTPPSSED